MTGDEMIIKLLQLNAELEFKYKKLKTFDMSYEQTLRYVQENLALVDKYIKECEE